MMGFAREGYPFLIGATLLAVIAFALALRLRSWPLWLAAFGFIVLALSVSWYFRETSATARHLGDAGASISAISTQTLASSSSSLKPVVAA